MWFSGLAAGREAAAMQPLARGARNARSAAHAAHDNDSAARPVAIRLLCILLAFLALADVQARAASAAAAFVGAVPPCAPSFTANPPPPPPRGFALTRPRARSSCGTATARSRSASTPAARCGWSASSQRLRSRRISTLPLLRSAG